MPPLTIWFPSVLLPDTRGGSCHHRLAISARIRSHAPNTYVVAGWLTPIRTIRGEWILGHL
ncbi:hypothetical protein C8J46_109136 [Sphingomonas sp. PP-F2F-A104-K0414]|nr:hypothetical protein C8J46_109136 [Sphingomonas sp. PP-F2F-A104-K0414]TCQ06426.1 hypothetical protein C8J40_105214 [Sphingomonas sp. PP-CC-3A-396]